MKQLFSFLAIALLPTLGQADFPVPTGAPAARTFPFSMVGQLTFFNGSGSFVGSGTVVQPRGVLTAAHNLYDRIGGWSTDLVFRRGHYGETSLAVKSPVRIYVLAGYQANADTYGGNSFKAFSRDTGGIVFRKTVAGGGYLGWTTNPALLTGSGAKVALGYGAEQHSGEELLAVTAARPFGSVYRLFYESEGLGIEAGMSGGPVICTLPDGSLSLTGVVVSGAENRLAGGVRAVNIGTSNFIQSYLGEATAP